MPVVTDIKRQKKAETRYSVYLDNVYAFALTDLELSMSGLRVGQELTEAQAREHRDSAEQAKAYAASLRLLALRPRSRREVTDYLRRKGYGDDEIRGATERLERAGLLDDQAFAASWIASRQALRPRSRRRLEQELMVKGVSRDDMAAALAELEPEGELAALMRFIEKKRRLSQYQEPQKLTDYLARQGYSLGHIKKALERLDEL